jgi:hypothetical protein
MSNERKGKRPAAGYGTVYRKPNIYSTRRKKPPVVERLLDGRGESAGFTRSDAAAPSQSRSDGKGQNPVKRRSRRAARLGPVAR